MTRLTAAAGSLALGLILSAPAMAADLALVIGNHDYSRAPDAVSARADAEAVRDALQDGGYEVIYGSNLNRSGMRRLIADFAGRVEQADRVVVFYSGHALRSGGTSYLAPIDQNNESLVDVMMDGVPLDLVLRLAGSDESGAVVFVDGAQLDGFAPRPFAEPGLASISPPGGVLVVSAAAPGRAIARRSSGQSRFGRQLVRDFLSPGKTVAEAVRGLGSTAWVGGDTASSLTLVPADRDGGEEQPAPSTIESRLNLKISTRRGIQRTLTAQGYDTRGTEGIFGPGTRSAIRRWQTANNQEATGYLTQEQVALIDRQGRQAESEAPTPAQTEERLGLDRSERSAIQENLTRLGYDTRGTGGTFGAGTRAAIRNWQRANDLEATGYLMQDQVALINRQGRQAERDEPTSAQIEARLDLSRSERSAIQQNLSRLGYDTRGTDGIFGAGTRTAVRNWQRANDLEETGYLTRDQVAMINSQAREASAVPDGRTAAELEAELNLTGAERSAIQEDLNRLGYDTRGTDGVFGPGTRTAIRNWQRANGVEETGYLTQRQVALIWEQAQQQANTRPAPRNPESAEAQLDLARNDRLSVEQRLAYLGFSPGPQDGFFDSNTRQAIESYQQSRGFPATGYLDRPTVNRLVDETRGVQTGIVTGADVLIDILRGLGIDQQ